MTSRRILWAILLLGYASFTYWYTNTEGPLTEDEINAILARNASRDSGIDPATIEAFMRSDTGNQFIMVNLLDYNESPSGKFAGQDPQDLLGHYMEYMYPELLKRASHPIFAGRAVAEAMDLQGIEGAESWDSGALMRYRSRRDMFEIATNPVFAERHEYKLAALNKTIAYPVEVQLSFADPRFLLALIILVVGFTVDKLLARPRA